MNQEALALFEGHEAALPLYELFERKLLSAFPQTSMRVFKTQISCSKRYVYACVSFAQVKRRAELPEGYMVITLVLPYPLESLRVAVKTEARPGRWTTHIVLSRPGDLDEELFGWIAQAYAFAQSK